MTQNARQEQEPEIIKDLRLEAGAHEDIATNPRRYTSKVMREGAAELAKRYRALADALTALDTAVKGCGADIDDLGRYRCHAFDLCDPCEKDRDVAIRTLLGRTE